MTLVFLIGKSTFTLKVPYRRLGQAFDQGELFHFLIRKAVTRVLTAELKFVHSIRPEQFLWIFFSSVRPKPSNCKIWTEGLPYLW